MPLLDRRHALFTLSALALSGCASVPAAVASAFAPTGRLRASINLGNPILAARNTGTGEVSGVSVDLARGLAERLGVPVELVVTDAAAKSVETVRAGRADIGFFAVDPLRGEGIRFSAPYVLIEGAYLVKEGSPLRSNDEVDRAGTRIMVGRGSAYDLFLTREIKGATLLRAPTSPAVVDRFLAEGAEVAAGVRQQLEADAKRIPGLRLLPGRFMVIEQAMGVQAGRGEAAEAFLRRYVEEAKASGRVAASLQKHAIQGAIVAPPAAV